MLYIKYTKGGDSCPDHQAELEVRSAYIQSKESDVTICTSSEIVILAARTLVAEGVLEPHKVVFGYHGKEEHPDQFGRLELFSEAGFCCVGDKLLDRLISVPCVEREVEG